MDENDPGRCARDDALSARELAEREQAHANRALHESERRFRLLADATPVLIWTSGPDKLCDYFNQSWLDFVGRTMQQELGNGWAENVHPEDFERCLAIYVSSFDARKPFVMEYRLKHRNGAYRWILDRGVPRFAADGRFEGYIGGCTDIHDQKLAQAALRQSEEELRALANSIPQLAWMAGPDGAILWYNRGWYDYTDTTFEQMMGEGWHAVHDPRLLPEFVKRWKKSVATGEVFEMEFPLRGRDGRFRWFLSRANPVRDADGRVVRWFGTNTDVDQAKRVNEERAQLLEAERAARAEAERVSLMKDQFLATLSHELRTPLSAIVGWSRLLSSGNVTGEDLRQGLETITRNARAQTQLIADLLDMSRIVSGKIRIDVRRADLTAVIESAIVSIRPSAEARGIRLRKNIDPLAGPTWGDAHRLQQVVWNLLSNAVKFSPRGGLVDVTLKLNESQTEVIVSDTGTGIAPDFLPFVFERFRQADASTTRTHAGLGLGLSIAKHLVELHGGTIHAASEGPGRGATFKVVLPLSAFNEDESPEQREGDAVPAVDEHSFHLEGVKILVVDDAADARELIKRLLVEANAAVFTAASAAEAMLIVLSVRPDVIVSDIGMPGKDGYQFVRELRDQPGADIARTPAIALTAFARSEDRARAMLAGYQMHLSKPIEPQELLVTVASLAGRIRKRS